MKKNNYRHFEFLDGVRFLCALWVVFSHLGAPPVFRVLSETMQGRVADYLVLAQRGFGVTFNGTAAVVAFFVISGFCIHYPYANGKRLRVPASFYLARGTRIGIPTLVALAFASTLPNGLRDMGVVWSLYAEAIYYFLYPLLLRLYRKIGIHTVLIASFAVSIALSMVPDPMGGYLWCYGVGLSWLLCLPMWILGCVVAESISLERVQAFSLRKGSIVAARIFVVGFGGLAGVLTFSHIMPLKHSMLVFAAPCALWLLMEFCQTRPSFIYTKLAVLGQACFSIYLMHTQAPLLLMQILGTERSALNWPVVMITVAVLSAAFYWLVERPSHLLSKRLAKWRQPIDTILPPTGPAATT
ncbi:acyltransferase [Herbaspirillum sp. YR522]|uniref:acyltransferase family protein n=1 Tax=Herbaspirillum sp. YR522 TaxID=1144342 RepID=UPI00026F7703|nr:acyltransferase [Herbaspirillum sp. YR522]EJM98527.1 putative acyltransferase [Herbaspirillum sp. YR522]